MSTSDVLRARIRDEGWHSVAVSAEEVAVLDKEFDEIIAAIKSCPSFAEAAAGLDKLAELHGVLCLLWFKYHAALSSKQKEFVREYDRHDDSGVRLMAYEAIKKGQFPEGPWPYLPANE